MKLRSKILLPVGIALVTLIVGMHYLSTSILLQGFKRLEDDAMRLNVARAVAAYEEEVNKLATKSGDWAVWDDTYQYLDDRNEAFVKSNVNLIALTTIDVDAIVLADNQNQIVLDVQVHPGEGESTLGPSSIAPLIGKLPELTDHPELDHVTSGVVQTAHGPMMIAARPVINSNGEGPSRGTLIFSRKVDAALVEGIQQRTRLKVGIRRIGDLTTPADYQEALAMLGPKDPVLVRALSDDLIAGYSVIHDLHGAPLLLVRAAAPRTQYSWGKTTINFLLCALIAACVVTGVVVVLLIEKVILRRLAGLTQQVVSIGKSGDMSVRVTTQGEDELAMLASQVNLMLDSLQRGERERESLSQKLAETSRQAGMAEVATGILHNVGNVLNSVNVSTNVIAGKLRQSKVQNLSKAVDLIKSNEDRLGEFLSSDERGRELPAYLQRVAEYLSREHEGMLGEVKSLADSIDHIKQIVAAQQTYAKVAVALQFFDLTAAVEDAIRMHSHTLTRSSVQIIRKFDLLRPVYADRHLVVQILLNLITNAEKAMRNCHAARQLTICVGEVNLNGRPTARLHVIDNGVGIPQENLTRIFTNGFTTSADGHGFGLHTSANAARQMRGSLTVTSDGPGKGATFTLDLPLTPAEVSK